MTILNRLNGGKGSGFNITGSKSTVLKCRTPPPEKVFSYFNKKNGNVKLSSYRLN